jgi:predicted nuclease of predicted toxin-antitoxin system
MKILVDQNISFRLLPLIRVEFPDISHVKELGLIDFNDFDIFQFARSNGFDAILTLDEDFHYIQIAHGPPPKIIWLRTGNCSTKALASVIISHSEIIRNLEMDASLDCLEIFS